MSDRQSVLGRVVQLAKADIDALLDQAEDPQKMLDQLTREFTDTIAAAERAIATTGGELRLMERDRTEDLAAAKEWGEEAVTASRKADGLRAGGSAEEADRFDRLAKVALGREVQAEREAWQAEPAIAAQTAVVDRLRTGVDGMRTRLEALEVRQHEWVTGATWARARHRIPDGLESAHPLDPASEIPRFQDKLRREEARARGGHELAASALDGRFERLDSPGDTAEVEARLAALKATT
ncbi:PspA/IM30 family protein [Streptomyces sp. cg36]|uniref:PspA/IM30 family protein n=1 Tax=Streptomyces sp. cg36 TaxID=3238798 RepID=UPI0034E29070